MNVINRDIKIIKIYLMYDLCGKGFYCSIWYLWVFVFIVVFNNYFLNEKI